MKELTLPLPPSVNNLWLGNRRGRRWLDPKAKAFKETAARIALAAGVRPIWEPVEVDLAFFVSRQRDIDNSIKVTLDALSGICWADDSQVKRLSAEILPSAEPRTVLRFGPLLDEGGCRAAFERVLKRA